MEEIEVFLSDEKIRNEFYELLCQFGKELAIILNSESAYENVLKKSDLNIKTHLRSTQE